MLAPAARILVVEDVPDAVGAVAGLFPAARAARLAPTDALRTV